MTVPPMTTADVDELRTRLSNRQRWGSDDEREVAVLGSDGVSAVGGTAPPANPVAVL